VWFLFFKAELPRKLKKSTASLTSKQTGHMSDKEAGRARSRNKRQEDKRVAQTQQNGYVANAILELIGSVLFAVGAAAIIFGMSKPPKEKMYYELLGNWLWIVGSSFFVLGSVASIVTTRFG
jgi:hypothetical protein